VIHENKSTRVGFGSEIHDFLFVKDLGHVFARTLALPIFKAGYLVQTILAPLLHTDIHV
jgi:hypothetical protein